eukprot:366229-Chlamydomonas_euryale.AAC.71
MPSDRGHARTHIHSVSVLPTLPLPVVRTTLSHEPFNPPSSNPSLPTSPRGTHGKAVGLCAWTSPWKTHDADCIADTRASPADLLMRRKPPGGAHRTTAGQLDTSPGSKSGTPGGSCDFSGSCWVRCTVAAGRWMLPMGDPVDASQEVLEVQSPAAQGIHTPCTFNEKEVAAACNTVVLPIGVDTPERGPSVSADGAPHLMYCTPPTWKVGVTPRDPYPGNAFVTA